MKTYTRGNRRIWYDRSLRLWTLQELDDRTGNQVGEVDYFTAKRRAMAWLNDKRKKA